MPSLSTIGYYALHVSELRSIIQWTMWHDPVHERQKDEESETLTECFHLLNLTSRSFAAVIQELHPELLVPVCLFYLVLRGLDTIEDDMTIDIKEKEPLLRNLHNSLEDTAWTYNGNGPDEKDRELLVKFDNVAKEFVQIKPAYRKIIKEIAKRMGDGMADYAIDAVQSKEGVKTIKDYELYCHYVAGLVGEGLTRLFVEAKLATPALLERPQLMESMGQFLQQTNIIRDIREDHEDNRYFWPREVWSKYVPTLPDIFKPENKEKAMQCQSEMILMALRRADDCLFYMAGIKEQSVFNFVAIPQAMAIATLELCFQNYDLFLRNIKISKGNACKIMWDSTQNLQLVCETFRVYARKIHRKNVPQDPHFLDISIACANIERFIEGIFPTVTPRTLPPVQPQGEAEAKPADAAAVARQAEADQDDKWAIIYLAGAVFGTLAVIGALMVRVLANSTGPQKYTNVSCSLALHGGLVHVSTSHSNPSPKASFSQEADPPNRLLSIQDILSCKILNTNVQPHFPLSTAAKHVLLMALERVNS